MTVEQIVFACLANENNWINIKGKIVHRDGPTEGVGIEHYPIFSYFPKDDHPWAIGHSPGFGLAETNDVIRFRVGVQVYLNLLLPTE